MAHFVRTHTNAAWTNGGGGNYVTLSTDWESLDTKLFGSVNGDKGGTWAPSSPIIFGDVGNTASPSLTVTSPTLIAFGGSIRTLNSSRFRFDPTVGYPKFAATHPGRKRTLVTSCLRRQATPPYTWITRPALASVQSIACTVYSVETAPTLFVETVTRTGLIQPSFHVPLEVHDGARLTKATLGFRVPIPRSSAPVVAPMMRIVAIDVSGNILPLKKTDDGTGYVPITSASSGTNWYAGGNAQSFAYVCDQNQTIDVSTYWYELQVIEEVGTLTPPKIGQVDGILVVEKKTTVHAASTADITLSGVQTVDTLITFTGARILAKDQSDPTQNGIWVAAGGTWTRALDADEPPDFSPNFLVGVGKDAAGGGGVTPQMGQIWQYATVGAIVVGTTKLTFQRRQPTGNIYHAVSCDFDSITDLRFQ